MRNLKLIFNSTEFYETLSQADAIAFGQRSARGDANKKQAALYYVIYDMLRVVNIGDPDSDFLCCELSTFMNFFQPPGVLKPVNMWYQYMKNEVSICYETGEIATIVLDNNIKFTKFQLVCKLVMGINWSPDEEYAVVISDDKLYIINYDFVTISEISLSDSSVGELHLVNVGWGKKETQFHGSEGKKAAISQPVTPDNVPNLHSIITNWRADSVCFAVGYFCNLKNIRQVKIFNSDGQLQSVSEEVPGLLEPLSWKPGGNLTFCQKLNNKHLIGFMEKNGLKHGDFEIPGYLQVNDLCWNGAGNILCLVCKNKETEQDEILVWTVSNYHWYLKQAFKHPSPSKFVCWDKDVPNRLYILRSCGILHTLEWTLSVDSSFNSACPDSSLVAVINKDKILVTSFKNGIVPPPMCSFELNCPDAVNQVIFSPNESDVLLCAVLSSGSLAMFPKDGFEPFIFSVVTEPEVPKEFLSLALYEWVDNDHFLVCYSSRKTSSISLLERRQSQFYLSASHKIVGDIITCTRHKGNAIIQTNDGKLINWTSSSNSLEPLNKQFHEPCYDVQIHDSGIYSLSEWGRLYVDGSKIDFSSISDKVTSFLLRHPFILTTTSSHQLVIFYLHDMQNVLSPRKLERGSRLVTTFSNSVILQAPRGNLETIQPRAFTILAARQMIDNKNYREAFSLLRKQRIDLNLIVDHDLKTFLSETKNFVQQVDCNWIPLLITELSEDDVTRTLYKQFYYTQDREQFSAGTKVKSVCESLISAMSDDQLKEKYILPILSALVKCGKLYDAITLASTEQALQHLMFLVDSNTLYLGAIGAYNLEAALQIAEKSQKDPKEYIPYLNSLQKMEPNYMKFVIDKTQNKKLSALVHLAQCGSEHDDEVFQFIADNILYADALRVFKNDAERYKRIAEMYAKYLFDERHYEDSGIMYLKAGPEHFEEAVHAFSKIGNWRQALSIMVKAKCSKEKISETAESLVNTLISSYKFRDAAQVYNDWLSSPDKAVEMFVQGKHWPEAVYSASLLGRDNLMEMIKEALLAAVEIMMESIKANTKKMNLYVQRLEVVRKEKKEKPTNPFFASDDFSDSASETSSRSSSYTNSMRSKSSRNSKKMNRKIFSLKEGNKREEESLTAALSEIIQSAEKYIDDIHTMCSVLTSSFNEDEVAKSLQSVMNEWLTTIEESKEKIWPKDPDATKAELFDLKFKHPPDTNITSDWELQILK